MNSTFHILKRKGERKIKKETELACEIYRQAEREPSSMLLTASQEEMLGCSIHWHPWGTVPLVADLKLTE